MNEKVGLALRRRLTAADPADRLSVQVYLGGARPQAVTAGEEAQTPARVKLADAARARTAAGLAHFIAELESMPELPGPRHFRELSRHWISHSFGAEVSPAVLRAMVERPEVEHVELIGRARVEDLLPRGSLAPTVTAAEAAAEAEAALAAAPDRAEHLDVIGAPLLWDLDLRGNGVVVAVIDAGVDFRHPDLDGRRWHGTGFPHAGFDFEVPGREPTDEIGHGTFCAGLIAGDGTTGFTTGAAPAATLMSLRIGGEGDLAAQVRSAFEFAIEQDVDVISMSMGWSADLAPDYVGWRRACEFLLDAGIVHLCSAGDEGMPVAIVGGVTAVPRNIPAPAICPPPWLHPAQTAGGRSSAIACGNTTPPPLEVRHAASGRGPGTWDTAPFADYPFPEGQGLLKPDLCAPGQGAMSCNLAFVDDHSRPPHIPVGGTSAATAIVAGCVALLVQAAKQSGNPVVPERIQQALETTAAPISGQTNKLNSIGSGRVNVRAAYERGVENGWWE